MLALIAGRLGIRVRFNPLLFPLRLFRMAKSEVAFREETVHGALAVQVVASGLQRKLGFCNRVFRIFASVEVLRLLEMRWPEVGNSLNDLIDNLLRHRVIVVTV